MAQALNIPAIPPFQADTDQSSLATRWKKWRDRFDLYVTATGINNDKQKRALLLHLAGESVQDVFRGLKDTGDDFTTASEKLDEYFLPKKNVRYERYVFKDANQQEGETIAQFVTRLRSLAITCEFPDSDDAIADQVVEKCRSTHLKRRLLRESDMTLDKILDIARATETSELQSQKMEVKSEPSPNTINNLSHKSGKFGPTDKKHTTFEKSKSKQNKNYECRNCGGDWPHRNTSCPAIGKTCGNCGKLNHFGSVCRSSRNRTQKPVNQMHAEVCFTDSSSDDEYVFTVCNKSSSVKSPTKQPKIAVKIAGTEVPILVDSGASVNVLDKAAYTEITKHKRVLLGKPKSKIFVYGSKTPLPVMGTFEANIETPDKICSAIFYVVDQNSGSLLGFETSTQLGILKLPTVADSFGQNLHSVINKQDKLPTVSGISHTSEQPLSSVDKLVSEFSDIFEGVGKLKDYQFKIHLDSSVKPIAQPPRRIPFHMRKQVELELENLEKADIIEKVEGPTPWVSPVVVVPKKDKSSVRVCVDMRCPNTAVQRERHPTPTIDGVIHDLNGATVLSKLDMRQGYHQIELHPESRYLTTFATHKGLRRYKRLLFGLSSASEIFQDVIQQTLSDIPGVKNLSDDIIVFGRTQTEHDKSLRMVFQRLRDKNLTLRLENCVFNKPSLEFFGFMFSKQGISPDPAKVDAVKNAPIPKDASAVRSFLGMTNYVSRFIHGYATITEPLRELTRQNVKFDWTEKHQDAFDRLKLSLSDASVVSYFDPNNETEIYVDASPVGVAAILTQVDDKGQHRVISYSSRTLSDVERRYSQTEREALAIVWACEKFHLHVFGQSFTVITDHKPLIPMFNKPRFQCPARIERWQLRLQPYDMKVVYQPGANNPADFLSRHPQPTRSFSDRNKADEYVNFIAENAVPKSLTLTDIQNATKQDCVMTKLMAAVSSGKWDKHDPDLQQFFKIRHELILAPSGDILLRGSRIIIPKTLRSHILQLAHEGHQGIVKTKRLLREKVWYPGIDKDTETLISQCIPCQVNGQSPKPEPLKMTDMPDKPWSHVSADFCGPFPNGDYLLVVIDDYSRYPEVEVVKSTSAACVIPKFDRIFSTHGIVEVLKTDNGPPFNGSEFAHFAEIQGFKHRKVTPYWPKANGEVERFMRTIEKSVRSSFVEKGKWKKYLNQFLLNYRATPHSTTGVSPAELLFSRPIKTKLPEYINFSCNEKHQSAKQSDAQAKLKMKARSDGKSGARVSNLKPGDTVLLATKRENKLSTKFDKRPFKVVSTKGSMVIVQGPNGEQYARNCSHLKKISRINLPEVEVDDPYDYLDIPPEQNQQTIPKRFPTRNRVRPAYLSDYV